MSMSMGIVYGEALARFAGPVAGSRDCCREKPWIVLDKPKKEGRIRASLVVSQKELDSSMFRLSITQRWIAREQFAGHLANMLSCYPLRL